MLRRSGRYLVGVTLQPVTITVSNFWRLLPNRVLPEGFIILVVNLKDFCYVFGRRIPNYSGMCSIGGYCQLQCRSPQDLRRFQKDRWQDHHIWGMRGYHLKVPISKARFHWQDQVPICERGMSQNKDWYDWFSRLPCGRNFTRDLGWCPTWYPAVFNPPSFSLLMNNWTVSEPPTAL